MRPIEVRSREKNQIDIKKLRISGVERSPTPLILDWEESIYKEFGNCFSIYLLSVFFVTLLKYSLALVKAYFTLSPIVGSGRTATVISSSGNSFRR
jgi:hypothetical protein